MSVELYVFCVDSGEQGRATIESLSLIFPQAKKDGFCWQLPYADGCVELSITPASDDLACYTDLCFYRPIASEFFQQDVFSLMVMTPAFAVMPGSAYVVANPDFIQHMPKEILDELIVVETLDDFMSAF